MQNNQFISNNNLYNDTNEYKMCAGLGCSKQGKHYLKIIYIKKSGWFCDNCTGELTKGGFILSENLKGNGI
jgi:hypothetical protein